MFHKFLHCKGLSLCFSHKTCFDNFNAQIFYGDRIGVVGRNGCGKSSLLKMIQGTLVSDQGKMIIPDDALIGYVPQIIQDLENLSGGQRFNESLAQVLRQSPNILLLDEPTNHLDQFHRKILWRKLRNSPEPLLLPLMILPLMMLSFCVIKLIFYGI